MFFKRHLLSFSQKPGGPGPPYCPSCPTPLPKSKQHTSIEIKFVKKRDPMERARSYTTQQCRSIQLYAAAEIQMNLDFSQSFNWVRKRAVFNALKVSRIFQCKKTLTEWSFLESRAEYLKDLNYFAFSNTQSKYKMKWTKILQRLQRKRSQHNYSASCRFNSLLFFS